MGSIKKPVRIIETGEVFESATACALVIGGHQGSIWKHLAGQRKSADGYTFEYLTKEEYERDLGKSKECS